MMKIGIYGVLVFSRANGYLLPTENDGHYTYADTRMVDPRYARSTEDLICVISSQTAVEHLMPHGAREFKEQGRQDKKIPIGCCPAGDPMGKPYGPGMACCCGTVYDEEKQMCCESSCRVYSNSLSGLTRCNMDMVKETTTPLPWNDQTKTMPEPTPTSYEIPNPPAVTTELYEYEEEVGQCAKAWYVPSPMTAACTDFNNEGSYCSFSCPDNLKVRIPDNPNRVCQDSQWQGDVPQCCERDGCPSDLRVDFFFILDSSSSIKEKNFQYVREYVIGLISTMPIGLDKTRVGILTYNNDVIHRVKLNDFDKKADLMAAVDAIPYEGRGTKTNLALEFAVQQALTEENGDRPDVPNFVLVLTDGRATDDVRQGAPALRAKAAVIAVGVGKRIEKKELEIIAGDPSNVFMVADFRSLTGSNSAGSKTCTDAMLQAAAAKEGEGGNYRFRRDSESSAGSNDIIDRLNEAQAEINSLNESHANGRIDDGTYYSELRRLQILERHLMEKISQQQLAGDQIADSLNNQKNIAETCPQLVTSTSSASKGAVDLISESQKFTTSFICPKSCIWSEYTLYFPDNELSNY